MKIALYKNIVYGGEMEWEVNEYREKDTDYVRISEIADVEFVRLPESKTVPLQVQALKKAKDAADIAHLAVIKTIDDKIGKLLAITNQSEEQPR